LTKRASSNSILGNFANNNSTFSETSGGVGDGVCSNNVRTDIQGNASDDRNWFQLKTVASNDTINYSGAKR
jgi:hypothetical protein